MVLAAGMSRRMGQPKQVLPWGNRTVIEQVVETLLGGGVTDIVVVTGGAQALIEQALANYHVHLCANPDYQRFEMLSSLQVGIAGLAPHVPAVLVALGDQPFVRAETVTKIVKAYSQEQSTLIVPSYQMRRGHPWLVDRTYWAEIQAMNRWQTPRDFLNRHAGEISYISVDDPGILKDLDTPADYQRENPGK